VANGRYPGAAADADEASLARDAERVWGEMSALVAGAECGPFPQLTEAYAAEVCRFGVSTEIHNVAAFMGGAAAQECVKVITKQWAPANNTFVYNGIAGTAGTYEF
jgi:amyloid beta precursor protein binding protein 1